jgi:uncharacterized protein YbjT (DUF2867 family)
VADILVLGGTGKTGRRITRRLAEQGHTARAAARQPGPADRGVVPVHFDWDDPATHDVALAGAEAVYVVPPALRLDHPPLIAGLLSRASALGVRRAVLLSARGADQDPRSPLAQAEAAVVASGLDWTIVRPTWFAQNFTESFFRVGIDADGAVVAPAGDGAHPFIDAEDIAAVAVAALTDERHAGHAYDISGPRALTHAEATAVLAEASGRELRYVDADPAEWEAGIAAAGLPADYAGLLGMLVGLIRDGHDAAGQRRRPRRARPRRDRLRGLGRPRGGRARQGSRRARARRLTRTERAPSGASGAATRWRGRPRRSRRRGPAAGGDRPRAGGRGRGRSGGPGRWPCPPTSG